MSKNNSELWIFFQSCWTDLIFILHTFCVESVPFDKATFSGQDSNLQSVTSVNMWHSAFKSRAQPSRRLKLLNTHLLNIPIQAQNIRPSRYSARCAPVFRAMTKIFLSSRMSSGQEFWLLLQIINYLLLSKMYCMFQKICLFPWRIIGSISETIDMPTLLIAKLRREYLTRWMARWKAFYLLKGLSRVILCVFKNPGFSVWFFNPSCLPWVYLGG